MEPRYYIGLDGMASTAIRERRRTLRYGNLRVRQIVQMKIKISSLLMEVGVNYNKQRLHKAAYFRGLLASSPEVDDKLRSLLRHWNPRLAVKRCVHMPDGALVSGR